MNPCSSCGAGVAAGAAWCGQCFARVGATAPVPVSVGAGAQPSPQPLGWRPMAGIGEVQAKPERRTRWRKTQTTFGPVGRVLCTIGVVIPFIVMLVGGLIGDFFALGVAFIWAVVIMPWALKDIWRAGLMVERKRT